MTINDFILNIQERYNMPKEPQDNQRASDMYKKDFGFYGGSKLEKVWYAIKRYHGTNFAPNYSAIATCMEKAGIGEQRDGGDAKFYQVCKKCGAKYVMGVSCCPKCNKYLETKDGLIEIFMNAVEIVKCQELPDNVIKLRQPCSHCLTFRNSTIYPGGIKCHGFNTDLYGTLAECEKCPCNACCKDTGKKPEGEMRKLVQSLIKTVDSHMVVDS